MLRYGRFAVQPHSEPSPLRRLVRQRYLFPRTRFPNWIWTGPVRHCKITAAGRQVRIQPSMSLLRRAQRLLTNAAQDNRPPVMVIVSIGRSMGCCRLPACWVYSKVWSFAERAGAQWVILIIPPSCPCVYTLYDGKAPLVVLANFTRTHQRKGKRARKTKSPRFRGPLAGTIFSFECGDDGI